MLLRLPGRCCVGQSPHSPAGEQEDESVAAVEASSHFLFLNFLLITQINNFITASVDLVTFETPLVTKCLQKCNSHSIFEPSASKKQFSPRVSVLISDLLLHLCVRQGLQQGAPLVGISRVSDGYLHCGQGVFTATNQQTHVSARLSLLPQHLLSGHSAALWPEFEELHCFRFWQQGGDWLPEGVRPLVPAQLATDTVSDGGDKLSAEAQLGAELQGKLLWRVLPLRHVPLKLVHQGDVAHVDVELWSDRGADEWCEVATGQRHCAGKRWAPWWWPSGLPGPPGCCLWGTTRSAAGWRRRWREQRPAGSGPGRRRGSRQTSRASSASLYELRNAGIFSVPDASWKSWMQTITN